MATKYGAAACNEDRVWVEVPTASVEATGFVQAPTREGNGKCHVLFVPELAPAPGEIAWRMVFKAREAPDEAHHRR